MRTSIATGLKAAVLCSILGVASGSAQVCQTFDFQDGTLQGFTTELVFGSSVLWHAENNVCGAELSGHTTPNTLYYGLTSPACNFETGERNGANAVSPAIPIAGLEAPFTLDFNYLMAVEGPPFDETFVDVSPDGINWTQVATKLDFVNNNGAWNASTFDVSAALGGATSAYVRFRFDTTDSKFNGTIGWHVDDIVVCGASGTSVVEVPTLSRTGLLLLALATAAFAVFVVRRR